MRTQRGPEHGSVLRPEGYGTPGRFENQSGVDLGPRLPDGSRGPLAHEGERPGRWQRPRSVLHVPGLAPTAPTVLVEHRPIWLLFRVIGGSVKVGGFPAVCELHTEAEKLIGERVAFDGDAVQQVGELLLLSGGDVAQRRRRVKPNADILRAFLPGGWTVAAA